MRIALAYHRARSWSDWRARLSTKEKTRDSSPSFSPRNFENFVNFLEKPTKSLEIMADVDYDAVKAHPIAHRTSGQSNNVAHLKPHADPEEYAKLYKESIEQPTQFWDRVSFIRLLEWLMKFGEWPYIGNALLVLMKVYCRWPRSTYTGTDLTRLLWPVVSQLETFNGSQRED